MYLRELSFEQEVKDESRIAPIILLSALSYPPDLGSVADEYLVAEALDEFDEPSAISTGLQANDHLSCERGIEATNIFLMV
jgi:hypothetical protein